MKITGITKDRKPVVIELDGRCGISIVGTPEDESSLIDLLGVQAIARESWLYCRNSTISLLDCRLIDESDNFIDARIVSNSEQP